MNGVGGYKYMVSIDLNHPIDPLKIPEGYATLVFLEDGICRVTLPNEVEETVCTYICFSTENSYTEDVTTYLIVYNPKSHNKLPEYFGILTENPEPNMEKTAVQIGNNLRFHDGQPNFKFSITHDKVCHYLLHHSKLLLENGLILCTTHIDTKYLNKPSYVGYLVEECDNYLHVDMCAPSSTDLLVNGNLFVGAKNTVYNPKVEIDYSNISPDSIDDNDTTSHFTTSASKPATVIINGRSLMYVMECPFDGDIPKLLAYLYSIKNQPINGIRIFPNGLNQTVAFGESYCPSCGPMYMDIILKNKNSLKKV